jgi:hypothetical protein
MNIPMVTTMMDKLERPMSTSTEGLRNPGNKKTPLILASGVFAFSSGQKSVRLF